jgi:hypothetical protein
MLPRHSERTFAGAFTKDVSRKSNSRGEAHVDAEESIRRVKEGLIWFRASLSIGNIYPERMK